MRSTRNGRMEAVAGGLALAIVLAGVGRAQSVQLDPSGTLQRRTRPPTIETSLTPETTLAVGQQVTFTVTVDDPDGDLVTLCLLDPPIGLILPSVVDEPPPVTVEGRWLLWSYHTVPAGGRSELTFEARDGAHAPATRLSLPIRVVGSTFDVPVLTGDVTGDGVLDVVATAPEADVAGVADAGAIHVWAGGATPSGSPTATLVVPGAAPADHLGNVFAFGQSVQLADVTGDGIADVVASARDADVGGVVDAGALYVWAGGSSLLGATAPSATLTVPGAGASERLGEAAGQSVQIVDVTGDGLLDIVVTTPSASNSRGAVYVWAGGRTLSGGLAPTATLSVPGATAGDQLGVDTTWRMQGVLIEDLDGDGCRDVLALAIGADLGGFPDVGALYLFSGGGGLSGAVGPTATLTVPGALANDQLGFGVQQTVLLGDVTGDGRPDVVASASEADVGGVLNAGAVHVFAGGPGLSGATVPTASLVVPGVSAHHRLGAAGGSQGLVLADVSADGVLDVIATAVSANVGGVSDTGAVYAWFGGASLTGTASPSATLTVPGAHSSDNLGSAGQGQAIFVQDVTGDGLADVVVGASAADFDVANGCGAIYVFSGAGMSGAVAPVATLGVPGASDGAKLGSIIGGTQGILLADVTGDGTVDVVAGAEQAAVGGLHGAGALYVFAGGAGFSGTTHPTAAMPNPTPAQFDLMCRGERGQGIQLADVTGDDVLDLVVKNREEPSGTGTIFVFAGGAAIASSPTATLSVPGAAMDDGLGSAAGLGFRLLDLTDDGILDVVAGADAADHGAVDTGAVYLFPGGAGLTGAVAPATVLHVPGAAAGDRLGYAPVGARGLQLADVTGDGRPDLIGSAPLADVAGVSDAGALYLWEGPVPTAAPTVELAVPGASAGDGLGS